MQIKTIEKQDEKQVDDLVKAAFSDSMYGYQQEAEIVKKLRLDPQYQQKLEVVAWIDDAIVGHGLLSEGTVKNQHAHFVGLVLAPLSVLPSYQKMGIGRLLIQELEQRALDLGYRFISVLGDPNYYQKFGYQAASLYQIRAPFTVPDEAFMIKALHPEGLKGVQGTLYYAEAFS